MKRGKYGRYYVCLWGKRVFRSKRFKVAYRVHSILGFIPGMQVGMFRWMVL